MDARAVRAATVIAACRRGQLGRRAVRAQLLTAAHKRSVRARARRAQRQAAQERARSANLERHVRRHRAAAIPDRSARVAASAAPARQPSGRPTPQEVGETCDELREWLVRCPGSAEISSLLVECEGAALASEVAPAGTEELLETVAELERFASAANDSSSSATVALLDECVAELERRRAAARPAPLGELQRTATELRRLVASTTNSELHSMLSQTEAEIGRRHARRGR